MKGRDRFTRAEASRIRELLVEVRRAEPGTPQKILRDRLRAIGFYVSDWGGGPAGFTASEFDDLVERGVIRLEAGDQVKAAPAPARTRSAAVATAEAGQAKRAPSESVLVEQACDALHEPSMTISEALDGAIPNAPGLYAMHADASTREALDLGTPPDRRPLYVGKAETSLVARDLKTHFATGTTGRSSPRRSFAALLAGELRLVPMPRRPANPEPGKWTHFALEDPGDSRLTDWMHAQLTLACWVSPPGSVLSNVEGSLMRRWLPPLNLVGVSTPWTSEIRRARAVLADGAKAWARDRGLSTK